MELIKHAICLASNDITHRPLLKVRRELEDRLGYCVLANGRIFENLI